jgi:hypothetical protein
MWRTKRQGGLGQAKWHLEQAIDEVDDRVAAVIENGEAPFWQVSARRSSARGGLTLGKGGTRLRAYLDIDDSDLPARNAPRKRAKMAGRSGLRLNQKPA